MWLARSELVATAGEDPSLPSAAMASAAHANNPYMKTIPCSGRAIRPATTLPLPQVKPPRRRQVKKRSTKKTPMQVFESQCRVKLNKVHVCRKCKERKSCHKAHHPTCAHSNNYKCKIPIEVIELHARNKGKKRPKGDDADLRLRLYQSAPDCSCTVVGWPLYVTLSGPRGIHCRVWHRRERAMIASE